MFRESGSFSVSASIWALTHTRHNALSKWRDDATFEQTWNKVNCHSIYLNTDNFVTQIFCLFRYGVWTGFLDRRSFCIDLLINFLVEMVPKWVRASLPGLIIFRLFFDHTCTFYSGNTYKCQKTVFPTFFKKSKAFIHTCTFYPRNTYKCAMTVFTILKKKT